MTDTTKSKSKRGRGKGIMLYGLRDGRTDAGLSLRELEERSGVYAARISKLELLQQGAQPRTARKLADALGIEIRDLRSERALPGDSPREPSAGRAGE